MEQRKATSALVHSPQYVVQRMRILADVRQAFAVAHLHAPCEGSNACRICKRRASPLRTFALLAARNQNSLHEDVHLAAD